MATCREVMAWSASTCWRSCMLTCCSTSALFCVAAQRCSATLIWLCSRSCCSSSSAHRACQTSGTLQFMTGNMMSQP